MKLAATALCGLGLAATLSAGTVQSVPSGQVTKSFNAGGRIHLDLSAGDYTIKGYPEPVIRLRWEVRDSRDERRVRADVNVDGAAATIRVRGPNNRFRVEIDVPERADLDLTMTAGDIRIRGIEGNKRLSMWAGDVTIEVGDTALYRRVDATVRAGDLSARAFGQSTGGLFRSFRWDGKGKYTIDAALFAGDLKLVK
jgi:hypothetical protein